MRSPWLLALVVACRNPSASSLDASVGAPAESARELRGVALSPPSPKPQTDSDDHRRRPANGKAQCHMLDGTKVDSCAAGDSLCSCD